MSAIVDVADAVVAELNSGGYTETFAAARSYRPVYSVDQLEALVVSVVPGELAIAPLTRAHNSYDVTVWVVVERQVSPEDNAAVDALVSLCEQLAGRLGRKAEIVPGATLLAVEYEAPCDLERLDGERVFMAIVTASYRLPVVRVA